MDAFLSPNVKMFLHAGKFSEIVSSADFLKHFKKKYFSHPPVSYSLDPDGLSGLILVQTVFKGYLQTSLQTSLAGETF